VNFDQETELPSDGRAVRVRMGLGAGVVLLLIAAAIAVVISATTSHPAAAAPASYSHSSSASTTPSSTTGDDASGSSSSTTAFVQVVGQVRNPGVYELPAGDRIVDAIAAAGGFTAKADQASLNLAQVISDGQQIVVAARGAAGSVGSGTASGAGAGVSSTGTVDINTADATGLETLDGIGPALAQRIIAYRTAHNGFRSVNDLQNVTGIGPKKFAAIKGSVST
jgi:competence protein ComEA